MEKPRRSLDYCMTKCSTAYDNLVITSCASREEMVKAMGFKGMTGSAIAAIASSLQHGLLEKSGVGFVKFTNTFIHRLDKVDVTTSQPLQPSLSNYYMTSETIVTKRSRTRIALDVESDNETLRKIQSAWYKFVNEVREIKPD